MAITTIWKDVAGASAEDFNLSAKDLNVNGTRVAEWTTLGNAGYTLATAKTFSIGLTLPRDLRGGTIKTTGSFRFPMADGANGKARFGKADVTIYFPADATSNEKYLMGYNIAQLCSSGSFLNDAVRDQKI